MRLNKSIIFILTLTAGSIIFSRSDSAVKTFESQHILAFSTGISLNSVRDEMMSPLIYSGSLIPVEFSYRYRGLNNRHTLLFHYDHNDLTSSITNSTPGAHFINYLNLNLEYSYAFKAAGINSLNTILYLGARFSGMVNMRKHYFMQDKNHISAEQMTGLGIYLSAETSLLKEFDLLTAELNIPFISYALLTNRYNANVSDKFDNLDYEENIIWQLFKKGDFISFNKLFEIQADLSYSIFLSSNAGLGFLYRFQFYSFEEHQSLLHSKVLINQFLIVMMLKL